MPAISIAIPTYNSREYLLQAVSSVLREDLSDFEIVISDNCSEDNTEAAIRELAHPAIRYYRNERNLGSGRNFTRALRLATGTYVKLLCADDVLVQGALKKQVSVLEQRPEVALVSCDAMITDSELRPLEPMRFFPGEASGRRMRAMCLSTFNNYIGNPSSFLFRRADAEGLGWDTNYKWVADMKFGLQLLERGSYCSTNELGFLYRRHSSTDTAVNCPPGIHLPEFLRLTDELDSWNLLSCVQTMRRGGRDYVQRAARRIAGACAPSRLGQAVQAACDVRRMAAWARQPA